MDEAPRASSLNEEKKMTFPPFEMMGAALDKEGNIWAGYRKNRDAWFPEDLKEKHGPGHKSKTAYFAGCTASYVENDIAMASVRLLDAAGRRFYLRRQEGELLRHTNARCGKVGPLCRGGEAQHPGDERRGSQHRHHLLPCLQPDVASGLLLSGPRNSASTSTSPRSTTAR